MLVLHVTAGYDTFPKLTCISQLPTELQIQALQLLHLSQMCDAII